MLAKMKTLHYLLPCSQQFFQLAFGQREKQKYFCKPHQRPLEQLNQANQTDTS